MTEQVECSGCADNCPSFPALHGLGPVKQLYTLFEDDTLARTTASSLSVHLIIYRIVCCAGRSGSGRRRGTVARDGIPEIQLSTRPVEGIVTDRYSAPPSATQRYPAHRTCRDTSTPAASVVYAGRIRWPVVIRKHGSNGKPGVGRTAGGRGP